MRDGITYEEAKKFKWIEETNSRREARRHVYQMPRHVPVNLPYHLYNKIFVYLNAINWYGILHK